MTIYTVIATDYYAEGDVVVEMFTRKEDAIAYMADMFSKACSDPEITEVESDAFSTYGDHCYSWFDCRVSYKSTKVWMEPHWVN